MIKKTIGTNYNSAVPMVFGAAERTASVPAARVNKNMETVVTRSNNSYKNSNSLKDLSMSEILKIAEDRTRIAGISRRSTDNPWHKRMAMSDNITRGQALPNAPSNGQRMGSIAVEDQLDNNEEFFENLMQQMTREQFMPCDGTGRLRKRTCLWDKENLTTANTSKRRKEGKPNTKFIPPKMEFFTKRLLPQKIANNPLAQAKMQSDIQQDRAVPRHKSSRNFIQEDINMNEFNLRFENRSASIATTKSITESFRENQISENRISACTQETFNPKHNHHIDESCRDSIHEASPCRYYDEKYPDNFWDSPHHSTIEEYHESPVVPKSPVPDAIDTKFHTSQLTPPSSTESLCCKACHSAEIECNDEMTERGQ